MVSMCLAIVGCTLISAPLPAQAHPLQEVDLAAYLQHEDAKLRQSAVLILADAVLSVPDPRCMGPGIAPGEEVLSKMKTSELPTLFDYLRAYWQKPLPDKRVDWTVAPASRYEQLFRFYRVLKKVKGVEAFAFKSYIFPEEETITRLSLLGMTLAYNDKYKLKFEAFLNGSEPMKSLAKNTLELVGIKTK